MKNQNCPVCKIPMAAVQTIGEGVDDITLYKCPKCSKEVFVGDFTIRPLVVNGVSKTRTVGFGEARVSSRSSHKGGVW